MSPDRRPSRIEHPEEAGVYKEFFAPGELLAIKAQGETLIDPLPILARFGIDVKPEDRGPLITILASHNQSLNFKETEDGTRIYAQDIEELISSSSSAIWEIATKILPEKTRNTFFGELQIGIEHAYRQMTAENRQRKEKSAQDWQK